MTRVSQNLFLENMRYQAIKPASEFSGSTLIDFLSQDPSKPVGQILVTGTMPAGVSLARMTTIPLGLVFRVLVIEPGTETWQINKADGFLPMTQLPVWNPGESYSYELRKWAVDADPNNDIVQVHASAEDGVTGSQSQETYVSRTATQVAHYNKINRYPTGTTFTVATMAPPVIASRFFITLIDGVRTTYVPNAAGTAWEALA